MKKSLVILVIAIISSVFIETTHAGYTSVTPEFIIETLNTNFNADFQPLGTNDFSYYNPSDDNLIVATRMNDTVTRPNPFGPIDLLTGDGYNNPDQVWTSAAAIASARIIHTDNNSGQSFGYTGSLSWITGIGTDSEGNLISTVEEPVERTFDGQWEWIYTNGTESFLSNSATPDHMITFDITGLNNGYEKTWLLFWDDLQGENTGLYSDLVVEIKANPVPAPGAVLLSGIGIACVGWIKRRQLFM